MKYRAPQRRRAGPQVALFPFLAILVCTMGVLVVMLMVITRQAKAQAVAAAQAKASDLQADQAIEAQGLAWKVEQLRLGRQKSEEELAEARLRLGHVEDHARRLREELARREAAWAELAGGAAPAAAARQAEVARLHEAIAAAEAEVEKAKVEAARRRRSYAVVPYDGPHGTRRRPIYIECRSNSVVLQPENIAFSVRDFEGPMGPGNPLAAAIRATREYWASQQPGDATAAGEPYPLLLVRPDGIEAYYAARDALKSWGSEFGYELIGDDWPLAFPLPDPSLGEVVRRTVAAARVRQQELILAAPRSYGAAPREKFRALPGGGVARVGGDGDDDRRGSSGGWSGGRAAPRVQGDGFAAEGSAAGSATLGRRAGGQSTAGDGQSATGGREQSAAARQSAAVAGPSAAGGGQPRPEDWIAGQPPREAAATGGEPLRPGQWQPAPPQSKIADEAKPKRVAEVRGVDWAIKNATGRAVPVSRPIRVECYADRLVIDAERGVGPRREIPLPARTADSLDAFVSAVWEHMDGWGIAGRNMYWRPVLQVTVFAGGESRAGDLQTLLDGSGLEVVARAL